MSRGTNPTTKFKVDISELKAGIKEANKNIQLANAQFKAASAGMDDWSKSSDGLNAKLKQLSTVLDNQKAKLNSYKQQQRELDKAYEQNGKRADELKAAMQELARQGISKTSEEYKALEKALVEVEKEQAANKTASEKMQVTILNQQAAVNKTEKEIRNYEKTLSDLANESDDVADDLKETADSLDDASRSADKADGGFTVLKGTIANFAANVLTTLVGKLKDAAVHMVTFANSADKAMNGFAAETGASAKEVEKFKGSMLDIYNGNYGESFDDIANSMAEVKKQAGDIGADELEKLTKNALIMRDTFEFDINESMRTAKMMMDQFGLSGDEAYNMIAQGAQSGLDKNGDLLDSINEYSVHFSQLGLDAEEMFNMLANGSAAGTFSVDKLGDAVKEFGIRVKDGSDGSREAFEMLGYDADKLFQTFNEGGPKAADMTQILIDELATMPDSVEKTTAGVALFGTMWEDLGAKGIRALSELDGGISTTKDALSEINKIKYNSVGEALQGIKRNLETGILIPIGEHILPKVSELADKFSKWLDNPETKASIQEMSDNFIDLVDKGLKYVTEALKWIIDNKDALIAGIAGITAAMLTMNVANMILGVVKAFKAFKLAQEGATVAQWLLNVAMSANPIGLIVAAIAGLVTAFVVLWNKSEGFRNFWIGLWEAIKEAAKAVADWFVKAWTNTIDWFKNLWSSISGFFENLWSTITGAFQSVVDWFKNN